jgi:hypothetical protein
MKKQQKKEEAESLFEIQTRLFEEIQQSIAPQYALVDAISDALDISIDSAYRRLRCNKLLSIKETCELCRHFKISFDRLTGETFSRQHDFVYRPVNLSTPDGYLNYLLSCSNSFSSLRTSDDSSIILSAIELPLFHFAYQKELIFFRLYAWLQGIYNYEGSFDDFIREKDTPQINTLHNSIISNYENIPSTEIWSEKTIDNILWLINYYVETGNFTDRYYPLLLCGQVLNILDRLKRWTETGTKGDRNTQFKLYLAEVEFEGNFVLLNCSGIRNCLVGLFSINSLSVFDRDYCIETENYLDKLARRSILLCGGSEKERIRFFNTQRQKVRFLMDKIQLFINP